MQRALTQFVRTHASTSLSSSALARSALKTTSISCINSIQSLRFLHVARHAPGNVLDALRERGMVDALTHDEAKMRQSLQSPVSVYAGFDPTADSLHVGNLLIMMTLAHFQRHGHRPICLVGGATGLIGDPSGRSTERTLLKPEELKRNVAGISKNLQNFLQFSSSSISSSASSDPSSSTPTSSSSNDALLLNNYDWHGKMTAVEFLRDIGKFFRVGVMLSKDSVKSRLEGDGLSFTEFSYQLLQATDFMHLYQNYNCKIQLGGSDQWGNITAGCDLVRKRLGGEEVYGVTVPLLTTASGEKFGKSVGNAVWLDAAKTSPYHLYQYFVNTADADVARLLRLFTFMPLSEIESLMSEHMTAPEQFAAQKTLAAHATRMLHGDAGLEFAQRVTEVLFGKSRHLPLTEMKISAHEWLAVFGSLPSTSVPRAEFERGINVLDLAVHCGAFDNKVMAGKLVKGGGMYLNNERVTDPELMVTLKYTVDESLCILRTGKKNQMLIRVV